MLLLLWFICSCTCTMTIEGQQQHETVKAATTTQSNLHKLLGVQELIFPIQQLNMNTSSENMSSFSSVHIVWRWPNSDLGHQMSLPGGYILSQCALHLQTWPNCALHLKTWPNSDLGHQMPLPGGISDLSVHFTWIKWPHFKIYSCFTEVISTKDQWIQLSNFQFFCTIYYRKIYLYKTEVDAVPIHDLDENANSYTELEVVKPHTALNEEK